MVDLAKSVAQAFATQLNTTMEQIAGWGYPDLADDPQALYEMNIAEVIVPMPPGDLEQVAVLVREMHYGPDTWWSKNPDQHEAIDNPWPLDSVTIAFILDKMCNGSFSTNYTPDMCASDILRPKSR